MSEDVIKRLMGMIQNLHLRLVRMEALTGLEGIPEEWGITREKVVEIQEKTGLNQDDVIMTLIKNFGEWPKPEDIG
mgnify:CR=1 FL=1